MFLRCIFKETNNKNILAYGKNQKVINNLRIDTIFQLTYKSSSLNPNVNKNISNYE